MDSPERAAVLGPKGARNGPKIAQVCPVPLPKGQYGGYLYLCLYLYLYP